MSRNSVPRKLLELIEQNVPNGEEYHSADDYHIFRRLGKSKNHKWAYYAGSVFKDMDTYRHDLAARHNIVLIHHNEL